MTTINIMSDAQYHNQFITRDIRVPILKEFVEWIMTDKDDVHSVFDCLFHPNYAYNLDPKLVEFDRKLQDGVIELERPVVSMEADVVVNSLIDAIIDIEESEEYALFDLNVFEFETRVEAHKALAEIHHYLNQDEKKYCKWEGDWWLQVKHHQSYWYLQVAGRTPLTSYEELIEFSLSSVRAAYIEYVHSWVNSKDHHEPFICPEIC